VERWIDLNRCRWRFDDETWRLMPRDAGSPGRPIRWRLGATIGKMSEIAAAIAAAVEVQDAATREIARNAEQATQSTLVVSSNIEDLMRRVGETGESSIEVQSSAQSLWMDSSRLQEQVSLFLGQVHAS